MLSPTCQNAAETKKKHGVSSGKAKRFYPTVPDLHNQGSSTLKIQA
jgi:hypothetical protein